AQGYYGLALALFALGLMAKPMLVTLPFVLLLLDYWPFGRITLARSETVAAGRLRQERFLFLLLEKLPFLALSVVSCFVTFLAQRHGGAVSPSISLSARIANALVSYVRYLGKMFWPAKLSVLYPHPGHWPLWEPLACAALLVAIFGAAAMFGRRRPYLI